MIRPIGFQCEKVHKRQSDRQQIIERSRGRDGAQARLSPRLAVPEQTPGLNNHDESIRARLRRLMPNPTKQTAKYQALDVSARLWFAVCSPNPQLPQFDRQTVVGRRFLHRKEAECRIPLYEEYEKTRH